MQFVIRVYGVLRDEQDRILVSDEMIRGKFYTKFPGGGLEFGEGTRECVAREFLEETGLHVQVGEHLYTTDFYQQSAFNQNHQIVSIYYWVSSNEVNRLSTSTSKNHFTEHQLSEGKDCEVFRWIPINQITPEDVDLPIDKKVVELIISSHQSK